MSRRVYVVVGIVLSLVAAGCADGAPTTLDAALGQGAAPTALATTPPIPLPEPTAQRPAEPPIAEAGTAQSTAALATAAPLDPSPTVAPVVEPQATAAGAAPVSTPVAAADPPAISPTATTQAAPTVSAPVAPAPTEAAASAPDHTAGALIALVDVPVVNLLNGGTTSLASLSPNGATLLFFWAPH